MTILCESRLNFHRSKDTQRILMREFCPIPCAMLDFTFGWADTANLNRRPDQGYLRMYFRSSVQMVRCYDSAYWVMNRDVQNLDDLVVQTLFWGTTFDPRLRDPATWDWFFTDLCITRNNSWRTCQTNPELVASRVHSTLDDRGDWRFRRTVPRSVCRRREIAYWAVTDGLSNIGKHVQTSKCIIYQSILIY